MITVTQNFKDVMTSPAKEVEGYIVLQDGTELKASGDLQKYTITATGKFLKTSMKKIKCTLIGEYELTGTMIDVYLGVKVDSEYEYTLLGKFNITKSDFKKDSDTTELEGYDNMLRFQQEYTSVSDFPTTLFDYLGAVCSGAGVVLENDSIYNGSLEIPEDYYVDIPDTTYRDVLREICEVTGSNARILSNGNLMLEPIQETGEVLTYDNLLSYKLGEKYGGINSLVLSRQPQNDDVYLQDEEDIRTPTTRNILDLNKFNVTYSMDES